MQNKIHPVDPEELMAYLDGELNPVHASDVAEHLETCRECQILSAEYKSISQSLTSWDMEPKEPELSAEITEALDQYERQLQTGGFWNWLRGGGTRKLTPWFGGAVAGGVAAFILAIFMLFSLSRGEHESAPTADQKLALSVASPQSSPSGGDRDKLQAPSHPVPAETSGLQMSQVTAYLTDQQRAELARRKAQSDLASNLEVDSSAAPESGANHAVPPAPMILRTAQITVVTPNLDRARTEMDKVLQRYGGYVGELSASSPSDAARKLTATLRVPGNQLDAALADLKSLGRVESESQNGQDVTAQYVDLEARLSNSRKSEQRLLELLQQRTGKLSDVLEVENELSRVREEIERMEGERRLLSKQVQFATVTATVTEEYKAPARALPQSLGTRFHNAAVDGYQSVVDFGIGVALFVISDGPMLLLWAAILFFPARYAWRKFRNRGLPEDVR
jgi:hypothetical protein